MLQGNFCSYALTRIVNPAQDIFSVVRFVYIFQRINRSFSLLLDFAAVLQGNFCSYALTRIVNPAQDIFSVVCFVYIFQRINRSFLLLLDFAADAYRETTQKSARKTLRRRVKKRLIKALKLTSEKNPKVKIRQACKAA